MHVAYGRLAIPVLFALASMAALVPEAPAVPTVPANADVDADEPPAAEPVDRDTPQSIYAGTAIGYVLEANGNEVPKSGEQMMNALEKIGDFAQLPITYSAVALHSGMSAPRVVITPKISMGSPTPVAIKPGGKQPVDPDDNPGVIGVFPGGIGGFGGFGVAGPIQLPVSTGKLTKPNLEGRLFIAANMEKKDGTIKVKTFEFISWNSRKQKFDFGFIECDDVEPQIRMVDGVKCFSCHKNKGPILGLGPWSNTPHNDVLRTAIQNTLAPPKGGVPGVFGPPGAKTPVMFDGELGQPRRLDTGFISRSAKNASRGVTFDGMAVLLPQGPAVDAAVRTGADLIRDRDVYRAMTKTADGRKGLVVLMTAITAQGSLVETNQQAKVALDQAFTLNYPNFADKWVGIHKNSSSTLVDFNPSGSTGSLQQITTGSPGGGWGGGSTLQTHLMIVWSGDPKSIQDYETRRGEGDHGLPSNRQPSNPKAFVRPTVTLPGKPSVAVHATGLARLIGVTEADRSFFADKLAFAAGQINKPKVTAATIAKDVFSGPQFTEVLTAGEIPDREDFKDRFVKGLNEVMKTQGAGGLGLARKDYASGPNVAPIPGKEEKELPVVATTACIRCHDVRGPGKAAFSPIPMLAFDPFDKTSRDAWLKANPEAKKRVPVLARMLKRLSEDRDMPPEDSAEYETFRTKNPAGMDAVKEWLDAELKKAKGG